LRIIRLRGLPRTLADWELGPAIAVGQNEYLFIAGHDRQASLREKPTNNVFGILRFSADGAVHPHDSFSPED
jgi:hypothetical protein